MSFYRVTPGQSPAMVARALGTSVSALMRANSHKPTTVVAGPDGKSRRTFQSLRYNELLHKPRAGVGALGDDGTLGVTPADPGAPHALILKGSSGADVALWQKILGVTADGVFGSGTEAATKAWQSSHGLNPDGKVGQGTWAKALGNASSAPVAVSTPASGQGLSMAAGAAYTALNMDPNYCVSVAKAGTPVNNAIHNFKAAWNAANPGQKVPIGTGNYEPSVAVALSSALAGVPVPPGCNTARKPVAAAPTVAPPLPDPVQSAPPMVTPVNVAPPSAGPNVPSAVLALLSFDPCDPANAALVCQAQSALGFVPGAGVDGKWGADAAARARKLIPNAPAGCSPRPLWWSPKGSSNCGGSLSIPAAAPVASAAAPAAAAAAAAAAGAVTQGQADAAAAVAQAAIDAAARAAAAATTQKQADDAAAAAKVAQAALDTAAAKGGTAPGSSIVEKKISTGAIVAGAVGATALVGLLAMAAMGKKKTGRRGPSGKRGKRGPAKRKTKRKSRR